MSDVIPGPYIEALDGWAAPILFVLMVSALVYLFRIWRDAVYSIKYMDEAARSDAKGAWAAAVLFFGIGLKNDVLWLWRHQINHGGSVDGFKTACQIMLFVGSACIVWGGICWMRSVLPIRCSPWAWVWVSAGSAAAAIWFAMPY